VAGGIVLVILTVLSDYWEQALSPKKIMVNDNNLIIWLIILSVNILLGFDNFNSET